MVEQSHASECHGNAVLVAGHDDMVVTHAAASLSNVLYATLVGTLNVVTEGEEGIRAESHLGVLGYPLLLLCHRQYLRLLREELLPSTIAQHVVVLVLRDVYIDGVVAVSTTDTLLEGQCHHFRMLAQPPDVSLVASQTRTVDTALLTSTDTNKVLFWVGIFSKSAGSSSLISLRPCSKVTPKHCLVSMGAGL